ncbi:MAG TPA: Glu/Leu/Phe/Val dehydrogenase dimerization domain-containing protein [Ktedonobacteraceae bacterium]|nr:Glu/Leu/Phe/Val dehydrogenase dimerization domain-containing protein [Ktedonobacteraceae bacterium]
MKDFLFDAMEAHDYENIFFCQEKALGLKAIIVIHDTTLGPAAGGVRMKPYETEAEAIEDALRLARSMTYKNAAAGLPYGGGKCVVIGDPRHEKSEALFQALGRFIDRLGGLFLSGPDSGTGLREMEIMRLETPYVVTLPESWGGPGDSSPATAFGVLQGMRACLKAVFGSADLQGRSVAVQGVGAVGHDIVRHLVEGGAVVTVADVDEERVQAMVRQFGVQVTAPEAISRLAVDVYCPCALGGTLNAQSIPELRCAIVCGSANNQLAQDTDGDMLDQRGILYAPDYIVNAGGVISGLDSLNPGGFNKQRALEKVARLYDAMESVIAIAKEQHAPTYRAADLLAERRIAHGRQVKRLANYKL